MKEIEELYTLYKEDLVRYLYSLTRDAALSEDLLMETIMKAMLSLHTFKNESSIKTWLFGIARNCWLQSLRKRKEWLQFNDIHLTALSIQMHKDTPTQQKCQRCMEMIQRLPQRERTIMEKRLEGYSYHEIGTMLNLSEGSCRVIEFRIKNKLKEQLRKEGYDE